MQEKISVKDLRIRDPFVYLENDTYYLLGTFGGSKVLKDLDFLFYRSKDLQTFECMGYMVDEKYFEGYYHIWAPEVHVFNGKYYLIVSMNREDVGRGSMIFVSNSMEEKFVPLTGKYITPPWGCLDASLFVWKNKPYLYFSNEWTTPVTKDGDGALYVAELSSDLTEIVGECKRILSGKTCGFAVEISTESGYKGYVAEGPYAIEENGNIALYWSTFTKTGYTVAKSVAEDIFAEYVYERNVFSKDGGHCMLFRDKAGIEQIVLHQPNVGPLERLVSFEVEKL